MDRISYNSFKIVNFFENLNPKTSGIIFSTLIHLIILLFMTGLPNFFSQKEIYIPNVIPIEILNVDEKTNLKKSNSKKLENKNKEIITNQKKFNSSNKLEVKKNKEIKKTEIEEKNNPNQPVLEMKQPSNLEVKETKKVAIKEKEIVEIKNKVETFKTDIIKPKIKPKLKIINNEIVKSDLDVETNIKDKPKLEIDKTISKPKPKPEKDFSIASMLKDLRNEQTNIVKNKIKEDVEEVDNKSTDETDDNIMLSISEIDMLRQQLSSCWNAPAGAVIERGMQVTISAKVLQNMNVSSNSVRIVDTNIAKTNPFYGPITDSAMRTLLNPECTPLKLPQDKYNLWKNLTITFDYSIMKGS